MLRSLWRDDAGGVIVTEYVLVGTLLGTGVLSGLLLLRDAANEEMRQLAEEQRRLLHQQREAAPQRTRAALEPMQQRVCD